ncbi:Fic family protein [Luteibacter anthropi]|uniref:Fic family protein n=1 Tax=Luteibacter anthropi TaxID=564369 RepID=UPI002032D0EA|nr:Fic family protein [Luteibacter anthropi]URX61815.1 Fic family protein [Luteibacter anthropi]
MREHFSSDGTYVGYRHRGLHSDLRYFVPGLLRTQASKPAVETRLVQSGKGIDTRPLAARYLLYVICAWRADPKSLLRWPLRKKRLSDRYLVEQLACLRALSSLAGDMSIESLVLAHAGLVPASMRGIRDRAVWHGPFHSIHDAEWLYPPAASISLYLDNFFQACQAQGDPDRGFLCAAHFQLTAIHPFLDGNGRIARLLMGALIVRAGGTLLDACALVLMTVFYRKRLCAYQKDAMGRDVSALIALWSRMTHYAERLSRGLCLMLERKHHEETLVDDKLMFQEVLALALTYRDIYTS